MPRTYRPIKVLYTVTVMLNWSEGVTGAGDSWEAAIRDLFAKAREKLSATQYRRVAEALEETYTVQDYRRALAWVICEHCHDTKPCYLGSEALDCNTVQQEIADRLESARRHNDSLLHR